MARRTEPPYQMTVLSGPNAGAELGLSGAQKTLGGSAREDIQLDHLPDAALRFMIEGDRLILKPSAGVKVATRDGAALTEGRSSKLPLPVQVTIDGQISLHFCRAAIRRGFLARRAPVLAASAALIALCSFAISTLVSTSGLATASVATPTAEVAAPATVPASAPAAPRVACGRNCVEQAAERFQTLVDEAGIPGVLVTPDADIIRVSTQGLVKGDPRWASARAAYDREWAARVPVLLERTRPVPQAPFTIKSIWLGDRAEVVTSEGVIYGIGSVVPGGWTITAIKAGSVDLSSGGTSIRIEF